MSNNRFHNKYHRNSHHTTPIPSDIDSALDPIASEDNPFLGNFNLSGDLVLSGDHQVVAPSGDFSNLTTDEILVDSISPNSASEITIGSDLNIGVYSINGLELYNLTDVDNSVSGASDNDVIKYNGLSNKWELEASSANVASDAQATAGIAEDVSINPKQLHFVDYKFVPFTQYDGGSQALTQSTDGSWDYYISGFEGTGLDTTEIREILIECFAYDINAHNLQTSLTVYDSAYGSMGLVINRSYGGNTDGDCGSGNVVNIPINSTTTRLHFVNGTSGLYYPDIYFRIIGAKQRIFSA